jgi:hypothetical protein
MPFGYAFRNLEGRDHMARTLRTCVDEAQSTEAPQAPVWRKLAKTIPIDLQFSHTRSQCVWIDSKHFGGP